MIALWQHAPVSMRHLGRLLALDSGTLSPLLRRLEAGGLVHRRRGPGDERRVTVTLTDKGRDLRRQAETVPAGVSQRLGLDGEALRHLHVVLCGLIAASVPDAGPDAALA